MKTILNVVPEVWTGLSDDGCMLVIDIFLSFFSYRLHLHMVCIVQRLLAAICLRLNTDCE